jgi:hypothetical protein
MWELISDPTAWYNIWLVRPIMSVLFGWMLIEGYESCKDIFKISKGRA